MNKVENKEARKFLLEAEMNSKKGQNAKAIDLLEKAAQLGEPMAHANLGELYFIGLCLFFYIGG